MVLLCVFFPLLFFPPALSRFFGRDDGAAVCAPISGQQHWRGAAGMGGTRVTVSLLVKETEQGMQEKKNNLHLNVLVYSLCYVDVTVQTYLHKLKIFFLHKKICHIWIILPYYCTIKQLHMTQIYP